MSSYLTVSPLPVVASHPSAVCFLLRWPRVTPPGISPASCPVESGLSSTGEPAAATRPTPSRHYQRPRARVTPRRYLVQASGEEGPLCGVTGLAQRPPVGGGSFVPAFEPPQEVGSGRVHQVIVAEVVLDRGDHRQSGLGPRGHRNRHRPIEAHHRRGPQAFERSVQGLDLLPVRVLRRRCSRMQRSDRGLDLIRTRAF